MILLSQIAKYNAHVVRPRRAQPNVNQRGQPTPPPLAPQGLSPSRSELLPTVELVQLLDLVTASSGKRFLVDPRATRRIPMLSDHAPSELSYATLLAILRNNGYAAVEIEGFVNTFRMPTYERTRYYGTR